jgi:hypothetical protein
MGFANLLAELLGLWVAIVSGSIPRPGGSGFAGSQPSDKSAFKMWHLQIELDISSPTSYMSFPDWIRSVNFGSFSAAVLSQRN